MRSFIAFAAGFGSGWALRSIADSPQGVGVKLLEVAYTAKERLSEWAAVERERLEDMMAEARSNAERARPNGTNGHATEKDVA
jgi:hypothetical protein